MAKKPLIAIAWFRREDYQRIREISDDDMMPTFDDFEAKMAQAIPHFEAQGIALEKMIIDPHELLAYAKRTGAAKIDTQVRSAFAAFLLMKKYGG